MEDLRGKLLVAHPKLGERAFSRTVVLLAAHDEAGALGLILNRPTALEVAEVAATVAVLPCDGVVYEGGPVEPDGLVVLADFLPTIEDQLEIDGTLGLVRSDNGPPSEVAPHIDRCRVYAGHAGWGPGQLEHELAEQAWLVTDRLPGDLFSNDAERLWLRVLERLGGSFAQLAHPPDDPRLN
ncbi:MAG: YqgE/AlgH family protein [Patulibacter sp.]